MPIAVSVSKSKSKAIVSGLSGAPTPTTPLKAGWQCTRVEMTAGYEVSGEELVGTMICQGRW